jgi:hypothetical protein
MISAQIPKNAQTNLSQIDLLGIDLFVCGGPRVGSVFKSHVSNKARSLKSVCEERKVQLHHGDSLLRTLRPVYKICTSKRNLWIYFERTDLKNHLMPPKK